MGTRRSRHNKGRKPKYKEHRLGLIDVETLSSSDPRTQGETFGGSFEKAWHPTKPQEGLRCDNVRRESGNLSTISCANSQQIRRRSGADNNEGVGAGDRKTAEGFLEGVFQSLQERTDFAERALELGNARSARDEFVRSKEDANFSAAQGRGRGEGDSLLLRIKRGDNSKDHREPILNMHDVAVYEDMHDHLTRVGKIMHRKWYQNHDWTIIEAIVLDTLVDALEAANMGEFRCKKFWFRWLSTALRRRLGKELVYHFIDKMEPTDGRDARNSSIENRKAHIIVSGTVTQPNQIDAVFLNETLASINKLPKKQRSYLAARMEGATPLEIAREKGTSVEDVIDTLKQARDWISRV